MNLSDLRHTTVTKNNIDVVVLDTGAVIDSEAEAMLQALHSRSVGGLQHHLQILEKKGADNFMANFYVGYGHKSIGDCGTTTLFIEGISMLAAKAIQDWPLYSGQESSTRYIDFTTQPFRGPEVLQPIMEKLRNFYVSSLPLVQDFLAQKHPKSPEENQKTYDKAIAARAFDILRGFLPAGASTNLAWHTNLRQASDKLVSLRHHPLAEARLLAEMIEEALQKAHPNSFHHKKYPKTEEYTESTLQEYYYHDTHCPEFDFSHTLDWHLLPRDMLEQRPAKTELPKWLAEAGTITFTFQLDFGSYRDLQRHRSLTQRMPLLTTDLGFHSWYLDSLPSELQAEAESLLTELEHDLSQQDLTIEEKQYAIPMGYKVAQRATGPLPAWVYTIELRATRFVHPTLATLATHMGKTLQKAGADYGLAIHLDDDPGRFDAKRGEHDIEIKT